MSVKEDLLQACYKHVQKRMDHYKSEMTLIKESLESNDKSSDEEDDSGNSKLFEDLEKNSQYLSDASQMMETLKLINPKSFSEQCALGSVVETTANNYFLSASIGKIDLESSSYFAISLQSPIGQLLKNQSVGAPIQFNGNAFTITKIR